jgi:hypothetical protein
MTYLCSNADARSCNSQNPKMAEAYNRQMIESTPVSGGRFQKCHPAQELPSGCIRSIDQDDLYDGLIMIKKLWEYFALIAAVDFLEYSGKGLK